MPGARVSTSAYGSGAGDGSDWASAIAVDSLGQAYVTGVTGSSDFPNVRALQTTFGGDTWSSDAFVTKLNAAGSAFVYSTFLGGLDWEEGRGIALDASGNAYVVGSTYSTNFPTAAPIKGAPTEGDSDAFVAKIRPPNDSIKLSSSQNPSGSGVAVTFVATVWGSNPTGTVTFKRGSTTLGTVSLTGGVASYTTSTLVVGNHSITARYNGDASNPARTSPVLTQNVKGGAAPVVSITSPADQTVYDYPAAVAMLASASTSGGRTLNDVVFFREGAGSSGFAVGGTSPAYNTTWSGLPAGTHVFRARASDNTGAVTLSAPITVQLVVPPSPPAVALSAPAPGTQYTLPATVGLVAAATPGTGASVTKVEFFQGTTLLATDTAAPYGFDWVNPPTGDYSLSAKVTDSAQMSATSDPVAISVRLSGPGETVTFLHSDAAGNALAATDETGNALWKEAYRPYGRRVRFEAGSAGARLWFHGKAQDAETGLQYFGARYYDPFLGRFYGADPKGFDEGNIHSFNRYAYGNNNPLRYRDPDGRAAGLIVLEVGGAALIGGIYYATRSPAEQRELARSVNRAINAVFNENLNEGGSGGGSRANSGADSEGKGKAQEADKDRKRFFDKDQRQRAKDRSRDSDGDATCEYCGVKTTDQPGKPNSAQTDHVKAHSRGGRTTDDNAANSCLTCNASKGAKDFGTEWIPPNRR